MATKPNIGDVATAIPDPMLSDNFLLEIPSIPSVAGSGLVNTKNLSFQCRTVAKPGLTIENAEVQVFGHTLEYVGRKTFSHDMTVEYVENRFGVIQKQMEDWATYCRDTISQLGNYKGSLGGVDGYARTVILRMFDVKGVEVATYQIWNCWPSSVPEVSFDGSQAAVISLQIGFKYDFYSRLL